MEFLYFAHVDLKSQVGRRRPLGVIYIDHFWYHGSKLRIKETSTHISRLTLSSQLTRSFIDCVSLTNQTVPVWLAR